MVRYGSQAAAAAGGGHERVADRKRFLVRAHLSGLAPLPKEELTALKQSVAELGTIGRNLNQIARAVNQGETAALPGNGKRRHHVEDRRGPTGSLQGVVQSQRAELDRYS